MSQASKITLLASVAVSGYIIGYVHFKQSDDKNRMHQGVIRDMERQQQRQQEIRQDQITIDNHKMNDVQSLRDANLQLTKISQIENKFNKN